MPRPGAARARCAPRTCGSSGPWRGRGRPPRRRRGGLPDRTRSRPRRSNATSGARRWRWRRGAATLLEHAASSSLHRLGLRVARDRFDQACQTAAAESWSYSHSLGWLLDGELAERRRRGVELHLQFARFPCLKCIGDFDFGAQPSIDARLVDELATGRFIDEGRNVILLGPPGVGKTHIAIALGVRAA